jgi:hypothetical protein
MSEYRVITNKDKGFWNIEQESFVPEFKDASLINNSNELWSQIAKIKSKRIVTDISINVVKEVLEIENIKTIDLLD